ncbi:ferredoxin [Micromonospora sp. LOL_021]|uniref:ferredoxin n=1 Tax=Micromonospora sp. LOL_021 TaxID=3345417 RepID=UPI003A8821FB
MNDPHGARLQIDWARCDGRGLCIELLPELLTRDDWGFPISRDGSREPVVPAELRRHADRAVANCPELALRLTSAETPRRRR